MTFLIFYSIVLSVYGLINYYIFVRGMQALPDGSMVKTIFPWLFWLLVATFVVGRVLERIYLSSLSDALVWIGSFWLGAMLYFFLAVVVLDIVRLVNHFLPFFPSGISSSYDKVKVWFFGGIALTVFITLIAGHLNTLNPVVKTLKINIPKKANGMTQVNAVMMSDFHLGTLVGNGHFRKVVNKVNELEPDIIFLGGDVLDEDLEPVLRQNTGETLKLLQAPLGVYAVMGNHEYIGGAAAAYDYLKSYGLQIIRDSVVKIDDSFYIIGREDRDKERFTGRKRLALEDVVSKADLSYPLILMEHQPWQLEEAAELGVGLQLSGHTHHGQLWPLNYVTSAIYTVSRGYEMIGNMHVYVSSGLGTWGPPVRVGTRPEIVKLIITFNQE